MLTFAASKNNLNNTHVMANTDNILGKIIVGYRYGKAPECGHSTNYAANKQECGMSMACVGYNHETCSFAVSENEKLGKYYYIGEIAGTGSDDEICLCNVRELTEEEYAEALDETVEASNDVARYYYDTKVNAASYMYPLSERSYRKSYQDGYDRMIAKAQKRLAKALR